jgi:hypothetical protein
MLDVVDAVARETEPQNIAVVHDSGRFRSMHSRNHRPIHAGASIRRSSKNSPRVSGPEGSSFR